MALPSDKISRERGGDMLPYVLVVAMILFMVGFGIFLVCTGIHMLKKQYEWHKAGVLSTYANLVSIEKRERTYEYQVNDKKYSRRLIMRSPWMYSCGGSPPDKIAVMYQPDNPAKALFLRPGSKPSKGRIAWMWCGGAAVIAEGLFVLWVAGYLAWKLF